LKKLLLLSFGLLLVVVFAAACGGSTSASDTSDAVAAGKALFMQQTIGTNPGCASCHSLEPDKVIVGPSLAAIAPDAAGEAKDAGISTEEMLRQMITDPNAEIAGGFQPNIMPQDWGTQLTETQLNNIIAFLMTLK